MSKQLILLTGVGRCGTGWMTFFLFLNSKIAVWDGPGMGYLPGYNVAPDTKKKLPLETFHDVWEDESHANLHSRNWDGYSYFKPYYDKRILKRRESDAYFLSNVMGERWWKMFDQYYDCNITCVYCGREIASHFRSFKRWYFIDGFPAKEFMLRLRESMKFMDEIVSAKIPVIGFNVADYTVKKCESKAKSLMDKLNIKMSSEQKTFVKKRRKLGKSPESKTAKKTEWVKKLEAVEKLSDADLLKELKTVPDFKRIKEKYDSFRERFEA